MARPTVAVSDLLCVGDSVTRVFQSDPSHLPPYPNETLIPTSFIIDKLEYTASSFLESGLPKKHTSVGFFVEFSHAAWPRVNDRLKIDAKVVSVDARRATFDIVIRDEATGALIGEGKHGRAVIRFD
jgi:predicted thioesterase